MAILIEGDTPLHIEIDIDLPKEEGTTSAILHMDGGDWYLTKGQAGSKWIAKGRMPWPRALERALTALGAS